MVRKKRTRKLKSGKSLSVIRRRISVAWKNLTLFLILFILSFILYSFSSNSLLVTFFGILSIILGFLTFAFLIALIVLSISKAGRN